MLNRVELDWKVCQACRPCAARQVCKPRAIQSLGPDEPVYIDYDRCLGCGVCAPACAYAAIQLRPSNAILRKG